MPKSKSAPGALTPREILLTPIELGSLFRWQGRRPLESSAPPPGGTRVQLRSFDILENKLGVRLPDSIEKFLPDHAYVEYDDGTTQIIARGGPSKGGPAFVRAGLAGDLRVKGQVQPAQESRDFQRGTKLLDEVFVPSRRADHVAQPARTYTAGVNRGQNLYGGHTNSNSYGTGAFRSSTGRAPAATRETWGHQTALGDGRLPADVQRSRRLLGPGFGSTRLGRAITRLAEDAGERLDRAPLQIGY